VPITSIGNNIELKSAGISDEGLVTFEQVPARLSTATIELQKMMRLDFLII
jgi:hypothetical protein